MYTIRPLISGKSLVTKKESPLKVRCVGYFSGKESPQHVGLSFGGVGVIFPASHHIHFHRKGWRSSTTHNRKSLIENLFVFHSIGSVSQSPREVFGRIIWQTMWMSCIICCWRYNHSYSARKPSSKTRNTIICAALGISYDASWCHHHRESIFIFLWMKR